MPRIHGRIDGRYAGSKAVASPGAWTDVALSSLDSSTGETPPEGDRTLVDLLVLETAGDAPVYILLRPHGEQADGTYTGAIRVPAGSGLPIGAYLPDAPITTIAVSGTCWITAITL